MLASQLEIKVEERTEELKQALELTTFLSNLFAHDLANILNGINLQTQYFEIQCPLNDIINSEVKDFFLGIKKLSKRGIRLIANVRKLTKLEEIGISMFPIEAISILKQAIDIARASFKGENVNISLITFKDVIFVNANDLLIDVFENILNNAIKYRDEEKGDVNVEIQVTRIKNHGKKFIKFEFKDDGIGIPDEMKSILFKKKKIIGRSKGMGIGLTLVKKIVESCEGKIWVEDAILDNANKGSNFVILLGEVFKG